MTTALVTGGNTGIGLETARALAARGDSVVITSRSLDKGRRASDAIERTTGRRVEVMPLDLASTRSIRSFAEAFVAAHPRLELLVLNAGLILTERRTTEDGFEEMFGVNHLGHFLLTRLLLPNVLRAAPARIVVVASRAHRRAPRGLDFDDLMSTRGFVPFTVYGKSKLANLYFARELSRRLEGTGVVVHSLHPGVVATEFAGADDARGSAHLFFRFARPFLKTPAQGAQTTLHVATAEEPGRTTGQYYADCRAVQPSRVALDDACARRLFEVSERLLALPPLDVDALRSRDR